MTEHLSLARFAELADAYGGVIARWPEPYRAPASKMAVEPEASTILAGAAALDDALDAWRVPGVSPQLRDRILATASTAGKRPLVRARLWWSGLGVAAALAGAVAGTAAVAIAAPGDLSPDSSTSFGDVAGQEG